MKRATASREARKPTKDVSVTFTITETAAGKLDVRAVIPDEAAGTLALALAELAMTSIREALRATLQQDPDVTETRMQ